MKTWILKGKMHITLPWFSRLPGYQGWLVVQFRFRRPRIRSYRMWARLAPPAPGTPADVARAMAEVGR